MMLVTGHALTLLTYIFSKQHSIDERDLKSYSFRSGGNLELFTSNKKFLVDLQFITNRNEVILTNEGKEYMQDFNDFCLRDVFDGNYDYAILKFLYTIEKPVALSCFPNSILSHAPEDGKSTGNEFLLQTYIQFRSSLNRYVEDKNGEYKINEIGKKYFDHLQSENKKQIEISNKPLVHIDSSTNFHGDHNVNAPGSEIKESFNKVREDPESKSISKQSLKTSKATLYWTIIIGAIAIIISILIAKHTI